MDTQPTGLYRQILLLADQALTGEADPLIAARSIDALAAGTRIEFDPPFLRLKGIVSQADDIPDPDQLSLWDPIAAAEKRQERKEFLDEFRAGILQACKDIQGFIPKLDQ